MKKQSLLINQLVKHEGMERLPYTDTVGKLTIGVGRNLTDNGITYQEAMYLLLNDINKTEREVTRTFEWYDDLDEVRQKVVVEMAFNLGLPRLLTFQKALNAMGQSQWETAAREMLDSKWARQVGQRAETLARQMRTGVYE